MPYQLKGVYLDFCSCGEQCYCQPQGASQGDDCQAVNAWHIERGAIDGTEVSGLTLVALSQVHGHIIAGRSVAYYVDLQASEPQREALWNAWSGKLGGPLADLVHLTGEMTALERAPIVYRLTGKHGTLQIANILSARLSPSPAGRGGHGDADTASDICTTMPGAQHGTAGAASYQMGAWGEGHGEVPRMDLRETRAVHGRFHFEG